VADPRAIQGYLSGYASTAPNAEQVLALLVACAPGQIRSVACYSQGGIGGTATIIDVRKNGVSTYHNPSNRPTLAAGQTGKFTSYAPDNGAVVGGDIIALVCAQAGGHTGVAATAALEEP